MLVLSRKRNQEIIVNGNVRIQVVSISGNTVRLGINAPREISIVRGELLEGEQLDEHDPIAQSTVAKSPELDFSVDCAVDFAVDVEI